MVQTGEEKSRLLISVVGLNYIFKRQNIEAGWVWDSGNTDEDEYFLTTFQPEPRIQNFWWNDSDIIEKFLRLHRTK